jgi:hypothetical protein
LEEKRISYQYLDTRSPGGRAAKLAGAAYVTAHGRLQFLLKEVALNGPYRTRISCKSFRLSNLGSSYAANKVSGIDSRNSGMSLAAALIGK